PPMILEDANCLNAASSRGQRKVISPSVPPHERKKRFPQFCARRGSVRNSAQVAHRRSCLSAVLHRVPGGFSDSTREPNAMRSQHVADAKRAEVARKQPWFEPVALL